MKMEMLLGCEPRTTEVYQFNSLSARLDSNQGPRRYKLRALPTELQADMRSKVTEFILVFCPNIQTVWNIPYRRTKNSSFSYNSSSQSSNARFTRAWLLDLNCKLRALLELVSKNVEVYLHVSRASACMTFIQADFPTKKRLSWCLKLYRTWLGETITGFSFTNVAPGGIKKVARSSNFPQHFSLLEMELHMKHSTNHLSIIAATT